MTNKTVPVTVGEAARGFRHAPHAAERAYDPAVTGEGLPDLPYEESVVRLEAALRAGQDSGIATDFDFDKFLAQKRAEYKAR